MGCLMSDKRLGQRLTSAREPPAKGADTQVPEASIFKCTNQRGDG